MDFKPTLPPVPATAIPAMPPSRLAAEPPKPLLSKFHLDAAEQQIQNLANEVNTGLAHVFDQIDRLSRRVKPQIEKLTAEERATWTRNDGSPPDDAEAALNKLEAVLKSFAK